MSANGLSPLVEIYELIDPRDGSVRYIGKANNSSDRLKRHRRDARKRNTPVYQWFRKLESLGLVPNVRVVSRISAEEWPHEEKRLIFEARLIHPNILNLADGGNEPKCPIETRRANGHKVAESRNRVVHKLLRELGQGVTYFTSRGDHARAQRQLECQRRLRSMSQSQKDAFAEEWIKSHPWHA